MSLDFKNYTSNPTSPSLDQIEVIPNDGVDLTTPARGIYIGVGGTMRITNGKGNIRNFVGLVAGTVLPIVATRIHATGTTATSIMALI